MSLFSVSTVLSHLVARSKALHLVAHLVAPSCRTEQSPFLSHFLVARSKALCESRFLNFSRITTLYPMYARRQIIPDKSFSHGFFRCHNRQKFLKPPEIKNALIALWARYKERCQVKIYDFIIMDNHAHLLMESPSSEHMGHFMRTVNSQLARIINEYFDRDSQAIRERYKSPKVTEAKYLTKVMQYIWMNCKKVNANSVPDKDRYCSVSWRLHDEIPRSFAHDKENDEEVAAYENLLDSYDRLPTDAVQTSKKFVKDLLNAALSADAALDASVLENSHTISDSVTVEFRGIRLSANLREYIPWDPGQF